MSSVFVPREKQPGETRVAVTPETVERLGRHGLSVTVESGAGAGSFLSDEEFEAAGASLAPAGSSDAWASADLVLTVGPPRPEDAAHLAEEAILVGLLAPFASDDLIATLVERRATSLAMELVPRISRAQSMDALSSQASIAGYKATVLAAARLAKYFPLLMTAAGTIKPARVVVMGAGVAGLQAVATARRLGAVVEVSDIRPAVEEQVESLGGKFIPLPDMGESGEGEGGYAREVTPEFLERQREIVADHLTRADVAITTALVPGRPAPKLINEDMIAGMRAGSVIVDLAIQQGGNCTLSRADEEVTSDNDVLVLAPSNLPASMSRDASVLYARNLLALVDLMTGDGSGDTGGDGEGEKPPGTLTLDRDDEIIDGSLLTHGGEVTHGPTAERLQKGDS